MSSTLPLPESSSHYPGETAIRIDSNPAGGVFLTLTQAYFMTAARITFSTTPDQVAGLSSAAPPGTANLPTSPSSSFAGDELLPCLCVAVKGSRWPVGPPISLSPSHLWFSILQILCWFCKIHISSYTDPNDVISILLGSCVNLVFIKNMKHAMFSYK